MRVLATHLLLLLASAGSAQQAARFPAKLIREYEIPGNGAVEGVAFIPKTSRFAATENTGVVSLWDLRTGEKLKEQSGLAMMSPLAATPDGASLVLFNRVGDLIILDSATLATKKTIEFERDSYSRKLALSPDGKRALIASGAPKVHLVDLEESKLIASRDKCSEYMNFVGFSADGKHCLFGGQAYQGKNPSTLGMRWDPAKDEVVFRWQFPAFGSAFGMWDLPDGRWAGVGGNPTKVMLWNPKTKEELKTIEPGGYLNAHTPDSKRVVIMGRDGIASVLDLSNQEPLLGTIATESDPHVLAMSGDGGELLIGTRQRSVLHWKLLNPAEALADAPKPDDPSRDLRVLGPDDLGDMTLLGHRSNILQLAPCPDNRHLITTGFDQRILLWDLEEKKIVRRVDEKGGGFSLYFGAAVSADGKNALLSAGQGKGQQNVSLWNANTLERIRKFDGLTDVAHNGAISQDGLLVAAGGREMIVWETATGKEVVKFDPGPGERGSRIFAVEFDAAGKNVFFSHNDNLYRQSVADKDARQVAKMGQVHAIRRRPKSEEIAVDVGSAIVFLNPKDLEEIRRVNVPEHASSLSFSADGKRFAATGGKYSLAWEIDGADPIFVNRETENRFSKGCLTPDGLRLIYTDGNRLKIAKLPPR